MKKLSLHKSLLFVLGLIFTVQIGYTQSLEWVKSAELLSYDTEEFSTIAVEVDMSGNIYTIGYFYGILDADIGDEEYPINSLGFTTTFVIKYDSDGNFIWARTIECINDGPYFSFPFDIKLIGTDQVIIYGSGLGDTDFDPSEAEYVLPLTPDSGYGYIWCLDGSGNLQWAQSISNINNLHIKSIPVDSDSNLYFTSTFSDEVDFDKGPGESIKVASGYSDNFILKLDIEGNFIWVKTLSSERPSESYLTANCINHNDEFYTTGYFQGTIDVDPGEEINLRTSFDHFSMITIKFDSDGNFIWAKQIDGLDDVIPVDMISDSSGVYIFGYMEDVTDFDPGDEIYNLYTGYTRNSFLLKLDHDGNFEWANHVGGTATVDPAAINIDSFGKIYATGNYTDGSVDLDPSESILLVKTPYSRYWEDHTDFLFKNFNSEGEFLWGHGSEALGNEIINDIDIEGTQLVLYGTNEDTDADFDLEEGHDGIHPDHDFFIWKLNLSYDGMQDTLNLTACESYKVPSGDETYYVPGSYSDTIVYFGCEKILSINLDFYDHPGSLTFEGGLYQAHPAGERIYYKWVDCDNDFALIPGQTEQYFFPRTEGNYAAIIRVDGCPDTTECINSGPLSLVNNVTSLNMRIHPNPTKGNINITVSEATNIQIYSAVGELIWQQFIQQGQNQIDLNAFAKGLYFITAKNENGEQISTQKIVLN